MTKMRKMRRPAGSTILYVAAGLFAVTAAASVVNNLFSFWTAVDQYVAQGYTAQEVVSGLLPSQLLPDLFRSIVVYGGVAAVVLGLGQINHRLSRFLVHGAEGEVPVPLESGEGQDRDTGLRTLDSAEHSEAAEAELVELAAPDGR